MRQVPHYLLIGNGRLARHFQHYFSLLGLSFESWHRPQSSALLQRKIRAATHVLILISDGAIESFLDGVDASLWGSNTNPMLGRSLLPAQTGPRCAAELASASPLPASDRYKTRIHCSGSLSTPKAFSAHPLMSFGERLYSEAQYHAIPFVIDEGAPPFEELLPGLPNPHVRLRAEFKPKYHALCVLAGNFSTLLWQKLFRDFETELGLPSSIAHPYLHQLVENWCDQPESALTGPLVRKDELTLSKNLQALENDPFQCVYQAFMTAYTDSTRTKETWP